MGGASNKNSGGDTGPGNRYKTPKPKRKALGLISGFAYHLKKGRESDLRKRKEYAENEKLKGTPDYQAGLELPPTITDVLAEQAAQKKRDGENEYKPKIIKPMLPIAGDGTSTDLPPSTSDTSLMSDAEILIKNKKKGRSQTILNQAQGLGNSSANTTKKTLGA